MMNSVEMPKVGPRPEPSGFFAQVSSVEYSKPHARTISNTSGTYLLIVHR